MDSHKRQEVEKFFYSGYVPLSQVTAMANLFPGMAGAAIGAASKTTSSQLQRELLEQTKTVTESALQVRPHPTTGTNVMHAFTAEGF